MAAPGISATSAFFIGVMIFGATVIAKVYAGIIFFHFSKFKSDYFEIADMTTTDVFFPLRLLKFRQYTWNDVYIK